LWGEAQGGFASRTQRVRSRAGSATLAETECVAMPKPEPGKSYLFVQCKSCGKHFRVVDEPLFEGRPVPVQNAPQMLTCRGCGAAAEYDPAEMHISSIERRKKTGF